MGRGKAGGWGWVRGAVTRRAGNTRRPPHGRGGVLCRAHDLRLHGGGGGAEQQHGLLVHDVQARAGGGAAGGVLGLGLGLGLGFGLGIV